MSKQVQQSVFDLILAGDSESAVEVLDRWAAEHGYAKTVPQVLEPVLTRIGELWESGEDLSLGQAYLAGKVATTVLERALTEEKSQPHPEVEKGPVVLGNIEDDCHSMGRKMVTAFLRAAGWRVFDLGNDVSPEAFVDKAIEVEAPIIGASAMMYTNAMNIRRLRDEIDNRGLQRGVSLAVGGAVFTLRPDLVQLVGADGMASSALRAPALMEGLLGMPPCRTARNTDSLRVWASLMAFKMSPTY